MSTRRPKNARRPLRGGVGDSPGGQSAFADLLRQKLAEDQTVPTENNRSVETFQTVSEDLTKGMRANLRDNAKREDLRQMADSMVRLMDEINRPDVSPEDARDMAGAVEAYRTAFQRLAPEEKQILAGFANELMADPSLESTKLLANPGSPRGGEMAGFYGDQPAMPAAPEGATPSLIAALRKARAQEMDFRGDQAEYDARTGGTAAPFGSTARGRSHQAILSSLIGEYGLNPAAVANATVADAAVAPFTPGPGVFLDRGQYPVDQRLSTYTGKDYAKGQRYGTAIDDTKVGREPGGLWNQLDYIEGRQAERTLPPGEPTLAPILGGLNDDPLVLRQPREEFPGQTDQIAQRQMTPEIRQAQDTLWRHSFGDTAFAGGASDLDSLRSLDGVRQGSADGFPLDWLAPWARGTTEQMGPDGMVIQAPMTPEQVTDTILSQSGFLAEQPYLRAAARERLIPQVAEAMQGYSGPGRTFARNPDGRRLLEQQGAIFPEPKPEPPRPVMTEEQRQKLMERLRRAGPKKNDLGFADPMNIPRMAGETMPNRLLASLLA